MNKNSENLIRKAISQGNIELAAQILDLSEPKYSKLWLSVEHVCPLCKKPKTDPKEIEFIDLTGMCLSCDHILPDGWDDARDLETDFINAENSLDLIGEEYDEIL